MERFFWRVQPFDIIRFYHFQLKDEEEKENHHEQHDAESTRIETQSACTSSAQKSQIGQHSVMKAGNLSTTIDHTGDKPNKRMKVKLHF